MKKPLLEIMAVLRTFGIDVNVALTTLAVTVTWLRKDNRRDDLRILLTHYVLAKSGITVPAIREGNIMVIPRKVWMSGKALPTPPFRFWHGPKIYVLEGPLEYRKYYTSRWYLSDKFKYNNALFVFAEKDVLGDYQIHDISFTLPGRIVEGAYVQHKHIRRLHSFDLQNGSTAATGVAVDYMTRSTIRWLYGFKHRNGVEPANLPELVCYKRDFSAKFIPNQGYPHSLEDYDIDDFKPRYAKYVPVSEYEGDIPSIAEEMEANGFECFYPTDGHLEAMVNGRNYTVDFSRAVVDIDAVVDRIFAVQNDEELESIQQCDLFNTLMDELDMDYLPLSKEDVPTFKQRFEQYCIEHAIDYVK